MHPVLSEMAHKAQWIAEHQLEASPLPLPQNLSLLKGELRGEPVEMISKAWQNDQFRLIRYTGLQVPNRMSTFNFVLYPQDSFDAPIFASDWVMLQDKLRIAVIDAMPLFPEELDYQKKWVKPFHSLYQKSLTIAPVFERKLSWSTKYLGSSACLATSAEGPSITRLASLWEAYLVLYLSLTKEMQSVDSQRVDASQKMA